jgi:hypothetical protein
MQTRRSKRCRPAPLILWSSRVANMSEGRDDRAVFLLQLILVGVTWTNSSNGFCNSRLSRFRMSIHVSLQLFIAIEVP